MQRRAFSSALLLGSAAALSACGFKLRRAQPLRLGRVLFRGFAASSPMAAALRRAIEASGETRVVESVNDADVVLHVMTDLREQLVTSTTGVGQVRTITLRMRLRFRVYTASDERSLIPDVELLQSRDMTYAETYALGKSLETEELYRVMQADIVDQVLHRLAAVSV